MLSSHREEGSAASENAAAKLLPGNFGKKESLFMELPFRSLLLLPSICSLICTAWSTLLFKAVPAVTDGDSFVSASTECCQPPRIPAASTAHGSRGLKREWAESNLCLVLPGAAVLEQRSSCSVAQKVSTSIPFPSGLNPSLEDAGD